MAITITRNRIIIGTITRLDIVTETHTVPLGPTTGEVIIRRETQQIDITTDTGTVIDKVRTQDKTFIDLTIAENTLDIIATLSGGAEPEITGTGESRRKTFRITNPIKEQTYGLIIESPGVKGTRRKYAFPKVIAAPTYNQSLSKGSLNTINMVFEVMAQFTENNEIIFGLIEELGEPE